MNDELNELLECYFRLWTDPHDKDDNFTPKHGQALSSLRNLLSELLGHHAISSVAYSESESTTADWLDISNTNFQEGPFRYYLRRKPKND